MVAAFVAVGADESVQRVITAVHRLSRRLTRWYDHQLADLQINAGEWSVLEQLARSPDDAPLTPSQLAQVANVAPSSMTHRLDRMVERGLISRAADPDNRTRVLVALTDAGYSLYAQAIRDANLVESDVLASLSQTPGGGAGGAAGDRDHRPGRGRPGGVVSTGPVSIIT